MITLNNSMTKPIFLFVKILFRVGLAMAAVLLFFTGSNFKSLDNLAISSAYFCAIEI